MGDYFASDHFKLLDKWKGQKRDKSNPEQNHAYEDLKKAYEVTEAWADEVKAKLFPTGVVKVHKRPTNQANFFRYYNWARIYPYPDAPKELAYTVGIGIGIGSADETGFVVKIDTTPDAKPALVSKYEEVRGAFNGQSPIVAILPVSEGLSKSFADLVTWSVEAIRGFKLRYDEVADRLELGEELSDTERPDLWPDQLRDEPVEPREESDDELPTDRVTDSAALLDSVDDLPVDSALLGRDTGECFVSTKSGHPRDPKVRAAVLARAKGRCEREECGEHRPYPGFLDVHHILGVVVSDRVWTCVALCPNCHREAHFAPDHEAINRLLMEYAKRFR